MKWKTKKKNVDSGVFVMNHMETYMGNGVRKWECKFATESVSNYYFIDSGSGYLMHAMLSIF